MRKRIVLIAVLLLLGAIVNVAVAWACVVRARSEAATRGAWLHGRELNDAKDRLKMLGWDDALHIPPTGITRSYRDDCLFGVTRLRVIDDGESSSSDDIQIVSVSLSPVPCVEVRAGLPCNSLHGAAFAASAATTSKVGLIEWPQVGVYVGRAYSLWSPRIPGLPLLPLWPGFAINTIFYAAILWLLFFAPRTMRRMIRRRRGLCPACAYPVGTSPVCTECGKPVQPILTIER